jgi:hypothetical protein
MKLVGDSAVDVIVRNCCIYYIWIFGVLVRQKYFLSIIIIIISVVVVAAAVVAAATAATVVVVVAVVVVIVAVVVVLVVLFVSLCSYFTSRCLWDGIAQSVYRLAKGWAGQGSNHGGSEIFRTCLDRPWGLPCLLYNGNRVFRGGGVNLPERGDDHPLHLSPKLKSRAIPLLPFWAFVTCSRVKCALLYLVAVPCAKVMQRRLTTPWLWQSGRWRAARLPSPPTAIQARCSFPN